MLRFLAGPVRVRVPATSANLGPGFDALGLALSLADEIDARVTRSGIAVTVTGEGAGELPLDRDHLVVRSMLTAFDRLGGRPAGLAVSCDNHIPQARGLGSSSAAIIGGILAARALVDGGDAALPDADVLRLATRIEGHPDNVAPCLLGGLTIAWMDEKGARAVRVRVAPEVRPVIFVPAERGLTEQARAALPGTVPHPDAAANAGRAALLVHALTSDPTLLLPATEDRLHQGYRAPGMPATAALVTDLRAMGIPAVVSGAGPSVLALCGPDRAPDEMPVTPGWRRLVLDIDATGATVRVD